MRENGVRVTCRKPPEVWLYQQGDRVAYTGIQPVQKVQGTVVCVNPSATSIVVRLDGGELLPYCLPINLVPLDPQEHNYKGLDPEPTEVMVRIRMMECELGLGHQIHRRTSYWRDRPVPAPGQVDGTEGQERPTGNG